ncbi:ankyrin repeat domain-containing protein [Verrucomicrobia bacterium]|nr:ankyrin repeat domain-containing protein [Verrucomicrobiota bacterium]
MKQLLTTIAALVLVGCGSSMSIHKAAGDGNIEAVKQYLDGGADVNAKYGGGWTPLHFATEKGHKEIANLLLKHGGKTAEELKATGNWSTQRTIPMIISQQNKKNSICETN